MTTSWDEASKCPRDGAYTGQVVMRKALKGGQGQLLTLICPETNCPYNKDGWIVQLMPDGTIPNPTPPEQRERIIPKMHFSRERQSRVLDELAAQAEQETRAGAEVRR